MYVTQFPFFTRQHVLALKATDMEWQTFVPELNGSVFYPMPVC